MERNNTPNQIPYGISNFELIRSKNYLYVDKTKFLEQLEASEPYISFLRPRRFGKSLLISMLEYYYDKRFSECFHELFGSTYIGMHPTLQHNTYAVLKFDFSGLATENPEELRRSFSSKVLTSLKYFQRDHGLEELNLLPAGEYPATILQDFFAEIYGKIDVPVYIIIDEYDHFANELLGFHPELFQEMVSGNGFVRKFYEVIKTATRDGIVQRIFMTGVSPVTLDSLTSGFNIVSSKSRDSRFHGMCGFTENEVRDLLAEILPLEASEQTCSNLLKEMEWLYDGYCFSEDSKERLFNSDMVLYYLMGIVQRGEAPREVLDPNIDSDHDKMKGLFSLKTEEDRIRNREILRNIVEGKEIWTQLAPGINFSEEFTQAKFLSLLYYLGFLTIEDSLGRQVKLKIPNHVIETLYLTYFNEVIQEVGDFSISDDSIAAGLAEIAREGKNELFVRNISIVLEKMSFRDYIKFDEKHIKLIAFCHALISSIFIVKSEYEVPAGYVDLALISPGNGGRNDNYNALIELKYIKKADRENRDLILDKREEAFRELEKYKSAPEFAAACSRGKLKKWILIFSNDKCILNEEVF